MRKIVVSILLGMLLAPLAVTPSQAYYFGRNKVHYDSFDWQVYHSPHFDLYYYPSEELLASQAILVAEQAYERLVTRLSHRPRNRIPLVLYSSHPSFQQTNVTPSLISEGTGGFTDTYRSRVVLPYPGSLTEFRHVINHELVHVFLLDILFGGTGAQHVAGSLGQFMMPPLWFMEGTAEYFSTGWDANAQLFLDDAIQNEYIHPLTQNFTDFLAYKEGQAVMRWLADKFGEGVLVELMRNLAGRGNLQKALEEFTGDNLEDISQEFLLDIKKRTWRDLAGRPAPVDDAFPLLDHSKAGRGFYLAPVFSPGGDMVAYFGDHDGEINLYLASTLDGREIRRLVTGQRSGKFESLHAFNTGVTFSPDGRRLALVVLAGGRDNLVIIDTDSGDELNRYTPELDSMRDPAWSPGGERIAFSGSVKGVTNLYLLDLADGSWITLTRDLAEQHEPIWIDDSRLLYAYSPPLIPGRFEIDNPQPPGFLDVEEFGTYPEIFEVGRGYDIWQVEVGGEATPYLSTAGDDRHPMIFADGGILFTSTTGGLEELWYQERADATPRMVYGPTGGVGTPSLSSDRSRLLFSSLNGGGYDIFVLEDLPGYLASPRAEQDSDPETWTFTPFAFNLDPGESAEKVAMKESEPDSLTGRSGDYETRFLVEAMGRQVTYDNLYGLYGSSIINFKDVLGDKEITLLLDVYGNISDSNMMLSYTNRKRRLNWTVGGYAFLSYYQVAVGSFGEYFVNDRLALEWRRGGYLSASYPFNIFMRMDADLNLYYSKREYYLGFDPWGKPVPVANPADPTAGLVERRTLIQPSLTLVYDNSLGSYIGPVKGSRWALSLGYAHDLGMGGEATARWLALGDWRHYRYGPGGHSLAFRLSSRWSEGYDPLTYYLGGPGNLRGYDYLEFGGTRTALGSVEWRFPFVNLIWFGGPLPFIWGGIGGSIFFDVGGAWDRDDFHPFRSGVSGLQFDDLRGDFGYGFQMRMGGMLMKWDFAWPTDLKNRGDRRVHFSLGTQF